MKKELFKNLSKTTLQFVLTGTLAFIVLFVYSLNAGEETIQASYQVTKTNVLENHAIENETTPEKKEIKTETRKEEAKVSSHVESSPIVTTPTIENTTTVVVSKEEVQEERTGVTPNNEDEQVVEALVEQPSVAFETVEEQEEVTTSSEKAPTNEKKETAKPLKNGWIKENGKTYYYKNGKKLKNTYVNYIYLNNKGEKTAKLGNFQATLFGAQAWANQDLNMRSTPSSQGKKIGTVSTGGKVTIISNENTTTHYIKVKYGKLTGYVYADYLLINLPDVIPDMYYEITNANQSIFQSSGYAISGITGKNLYGFQKKYNAKIGKQAYYAPLLYPVAKQLQQAYQYASQLGYNLKIYDSYRPYSVTKQVYQSFSTLYNKNKTVKQKVDYDKSGNYWGPGWFLAKSYSSHNRGIAVDLALTNTKGTELKAQSKMHALDTSSVVRYNNGTANKLKQIMTHAGFETLESEWWHFEEASYKNSPVNSFKIK